MMRVEGLVMFSLHEGYLFTAECDSIEPRYGRLFPERKTQVGYDLINVRDIEYPEDSPYDKEFGAPWGEGVVTQIHVPEGYKPIF